MQLKPLPAKGLIGIMAPSSPVDDDKLEKGIQYLESLGYRTLTSKSCYARTDYLAGDAFSRATELMELAKNHHVDAIFFARGGFGSMGILPHLDYQELIKQRKLMVGFSDITALQWGIYAKTGLPSLSAAMPAVDFANEPVDPDTEAYFWNFIETGKINYQTTQRTKIPTDRITGIAFPGTLSVAIRLCGTPYLPDLNKAMFFFEDVSESRHKIEGCFLQAFQSGWFDTAQALCLGSFTPPEKETFPENPSLTEIISRSLGQHYIPVLEEIPYGHTKFKIPLPVGQELSLSFGQFLSITSKTSLFNP